MQWRLVLWYAILISTYAVYLVSLWALWFGSSTQAAEHAKTILGVAPFILAICAPVLLTGRALHLATAGTLILLVACVSAGLLLQAAELPLIAVFFAATGWIVTNILNLRNSRKTHTLDVIRELRSNAELHKHRRNVFSKLGYTTKPTASQVRHLKTRRDYCPDWDKETPVFESLTYIGNLYESIAYAVRRHDLDRTVVEETVKNFFVLYYEDYFEFIKFHHERNANAYKHLIWLAEEFGALPYKALAQQPRPRRLARRRTLFRAAMRRRFENHGL